MNVGDRVRVVDDYPVLGLAGQPGTIEGKTGRMFIVRVDGHLPQFRFFQSDIGPELPRGHAEDAIRYATGYAGEWIRPEANVKTCTCGAKYDRDFPDAHSDWCDLYREVRRG